MLKKRSTSSLQFISAAAAATTAVTTSGAMSFRPSPTYRGGRNQWRSRGFSSRSYAPVNDHHGTGNNDANGEFRPNYNPRPPPYQFRPNFDPDYSQNQSFQPQFNQNQQFRPPPLYNQNQQFRPQGQRQPRFNQNQQSGSHGQPPPNYGHYRPQQQFRQRPSKPLDYRNWEYAKPGPPPSFERFTVLSYNILADYLAINHRGKLYFHIPRHILDWEFRKKNIMFELGLWSADILCFQEVDRFQDLEEDLKVRGYSGIWKMRTGEPVDGCAIFWRPSRFKLLHEESIEFSKLGLRDNVAQICVLESINANSSPGSALPACSEGHNKVVICNIHVLYNPRRGEIKLGQVRVLLDRAYATSKLWDDAPVVLCGDFNSTPKSSLYNFILEQKLNVCELPRDQISGQYSSEIRPKRPFSPNVRAQFSDKSIQSPTSVHGNEVLQETGIKGDSISTMQSASASASSDTKHENKNTALQFERTEESLGNEDVSKDEIQLSLRLESVDINESASGSYNNDDPNTKSFREKDNKENCSADVTIGTNSTNALNLDVTLPETLSSSHENDEACFTESLENIPSHSVTDDDNCSKKFIINDANIVVDEPTTHTSPNEPVEAIDGSVGEDSTSFLSDLHGTDGSETSELVLETSEVLDDSSGIDGEPYNMEKPAYDLSAWTPMEIEAATGSSECTTMEHPLKLKSTYSEVEDFSGTRDSNGEPQVTSYHRGFQGTVDYIWRSGGLQTVRVLAPIPKHAMQWTPGFPTKKWGSDHVALVAELAFDNNHSSCNSVAN